MNKIRITLSNFLLSKSQSSNKLVSCSGIRQFCDYTPKVSFEKSVNQVFLLGRVGITPQLRGSESKPCVIFTLATNTNYKYESGEVQQKTDWHRITVFKPYLRNTIMENLKKGSRVYVDGRILYGEFSDTKGVIHNTTTIIANDVIFVGGIKKKEDNLDEEVVETK